jgi:zinc transport system substrate-binding protein
MRQKIGIGLLVAAIGLTGYGVLRIGPARNTDNSGKLAVTASFYPLYEFAREVGGDKVDVTNITPAGAEPHEYEPSPQQLAAAMKSDVFLYNGGMMEPWTDKFVNGFSHTAMKGSEGIPLLPGGDPHYWLDPVLAQQTVEDIRVALAKADPADAAYFATRAKAVTAKLVALDMDYKAGLAQCQMHTVVTSHSAFSYLAARYGFEAQSIAGLSPEEEPSASRLAQLSALVKTNGIKYVFFESLVSPKLADTLAQETGAQPAVFDPIEGISDDNQKQGKDYFSVQRENLANLKLALACR